MVESNLIPNQNKYKVVTDPNTNEKWVKERIGENETYRHSLQTGPNGGSYFVSTGGRKIYESNVNKFVNVYPSDSQGRPPSGEARYR